MTGISFAKWHLPHSTAAEHNGKTHKAAIKDHKVAWDYEKVVQVRMTVDKNGMLQNTEIQLEVVQEYHSGPKAEKIILGYVKLNLAEYVDPTWEGEEPIVRRYLMQASKINSTLKVSIIDAGAQHPLSSLGFYSDEATGRRAYFHCVWGPPIPSCESAH